MILHDEPRLTLDQATMFESSGETANKTGGY